MPTSPTTRMAGPETGDSTCVDLLPLNATLPVASTAGRNVVAAVVMRCTRFRWSSEIVNAAGLFLAESAAVFGAFEHAATVATRATRRSRDFVRMVIGRLRWARGQARDRDRREQCWRRRGRRRIALRR